MCLSMLLQSFLAAVRCEMPSSTQSRLLTNKRLAAIVQLNNLAASCNTSYLASELFQVLMCATTELGPCAEPIEPYLVL